MFKIAEDIMKKIESVLTVNQPALAGGKSINVYAACMNCVNTCAGSCKGSCTGSCQRFSR